VSHAEQASRLPERILAEWRQLESRLDPAAPDAALVERIAALRDEHAQAIRDRAGEAHELGRSPFTLEDKLRG
jgi:hypothetical protein